MNQKNTLRNLKVGDFVEHKVIDKNGDEKTVKMRVVGKKGQPAKLPSATLTAPITSPEDVQLAEDGNAD